ncbi:MAG: aminotransferase class I/II-fold pyridoxal phosphate-dependent enzyme [Clostridiales bacterium]|nr:aminotransferase class I/II-fold pyridoxal phosphate-dependent enzyme [Clostridiales bacterium]
MLYFDSDYMEGAHPAILERLSALNLEKQPGYGSDAYCRQAKEKILAACACPQGEVFFLTGGTQTNAAVIKALLRPIQGVFSADTGHINVHEAGAIEGTGHKVLTLKNRQGKIAAQQVAAYMEGFFADESHPHMVQPGMVYISHPTEMGTLYTKGELQALREVCDKYDLPLFLDGARLGYGLAAEGTDVDLATIARYCDVFYIGGTKVGALFGEAVVFSRPRLAKGFFTLMKQQGALLAKGWLLGLQFDTLFTQNRYITIAQNALAMAQQLKEGLKTKGYEFAFDSPTNQQFVILENTHMEELAKKVSFSFWEKRDETHTVVRFATSWATSEEQVEELLRLL